ncbi:conjugative transposon protein TraM [Pedobacter cryotolerans]|uniref:Conjugative transposon protein TraM n=1 Tax=Pedobacter cryotolerans TaxID=2571270 RepID=A0A4V5P062_9SPHI|nr:conjugative transposon protein TraM [Pedobacter cryotolerans]TKC00046.1 conjugative transposon protein TraM [Pedobacter cryotolerans]
MKTELNRDKRRVLLFIPILIVPFMALGFYAMGGGRGDELLSKPSAGINTNLPNASFSTDTPKTKADYYQQADRNSSNKEDNGIAGIAGQLGFSDLKRKAGSQDEQTKQINEKLEALNREINKPEPVYGQPKTVAKAQPSNIKNDVDRLEALMKTMQDNKYEDPEMAQLNTMMQNILDIQHPERITQRMQFTQSLSPDSQFRATPAIIVDNQKAVQGATIKIRLQDTLRINGMLIPKGQELFGACRITNQRLLLDIKNIRLGTSIIPVDLSVYSLDGMIGIDAPEALLTGALNNGTDNAVRSIGFGGFDQSVATQVAGAGIDAARQLVSKKVRNIKVKLKSGYSVLLRNNQLSSR